VRDTCRRYHELAALGGFLDEQVTAALPRANGRELATLAGNAGARA
jgi:hypothetical protein